MMDLDNIARHAARGSQDRVKGAGKLGANRRVFLTSLQDAPGAL